MKQNRPKVIVITGSIGTGKSTAVDIIKEFGFTVLIRIKLSMKDTILEVSSITKLSIILARIY